jgi:hypothetical protein
MTFTFLRNDVSFGCAAQLSTKRRMFLFCATILASNERRNEKKLSVVIHALLFAWYVVGNSFTFLKHRGFVDFPITIGTCLSLPSLLTQSKTVSLFLQFFPPWQDSKKALWKQYTRAQRTKPSLQIKKNYQCGKMLRQDRDFSTIDAGKRQFEERRRREK